MRALRVVTYVLTSLASLLFIVLAIYGGAQLHRLQSGFSQLGSGFGGATSAITPGATSEEPGQFEYTPDTVPGIAEDDYAGMRENIARNGGEPSSSAESQYLYACETGVLPAADCP